MKKNLKVRGYIFSREFYGERVPQHIQNIVIRDFCKKKNLSYLLSASEYAMEDSYLILKQILKNIRKIDGIVAYSIFQLPISEEVRLKILKTILYKKKFIAFANEGFVIKNMTDMININNILLIKETLPACHNFKSWDN